jgi:hypothetical protein
MLKILFQNTNKVWIEFVLPILIYFLFSYIYLRNYNITDFWNYADQASYINASRKFYENFYIDPYRTIGYQFLLGCPSLFNLNLKIIFWPIFVNLFCFLISINTLSKICLYHSIKPFHVITILCLSSSIIIHINFALTEIFFISISLLAYKYFIDLNSYNGKNTDYLKWSFVMSLIALTKPGFLLFTCFFILTMIIRNRRKTLYILLPFLILITSQASAIKFHYGKFKLSYIGSLTYYRYLGSSIESFNTYNNFTASDFYRIQEQRDRIIKGYSLNQIDSISNLDYKNYLYNSPLSFSKAYVNNIVSNTFSSNLDETPFLYGINKIFNIIFTCFPILIFLYGLLKKQIFYTKLFPYFFIIYTILISGVSSMQGDRFHLVFYPFSILLIVIFITNLFQNNDRTVPNREY